MSAVAFPSRRAASIRTIATWSLVVLGLGVAVALPEQPQDLVLGALAGTATVLALIQPLVALPLLLFAVLIAGQTKLSWRDRGFSFLCTAIGQALLVVLSGQIITASSFNRAAKPLAQRSAPFISPRDQIVFFDNYLEGIAFYLHVEKPIWLVQAAERRGIMGSNYLAARRPAPAAGYGPVMLSYDEFAARFPYEETEDQQTSINAVFDDLASGKPMDRLICGDVGFGKTEVALTSVTPDSPAMAMLTRS